MASSFTRHKNTFLDHNSRALHTLLFPLPSRYTMAAQDLVMRARGVLRDRGWRITNERLGSGDDISAFIIPLMYGNRQPWGAEGLLNQQDWFELRIPVQFFLSAVCTLIFFLRQSRGYTKVWLFRFVGVSDLCRSSEWSAGATLCFLKLQKSEKHDKFRHLKSFDLPDDCLLNFCRDVKAEIEKCFQSEEKTFLFVLLPLLQCCICPLPSLLAPFSPILYSRQSL